MAFIGNTNITQAFTPAVDYFSGNGSTTAFTLSRPVASVAQVQVVVNNVAQNPSSAYTVSGNTITFTSAPSSGTNNIYVYYTSPITQVIAPGQNTVYPSSLSTTNALYWDTSGNVGIGTSSPAGPLNTVGYVYQDNYASSTALFLRRANGAASSKTTVANGNVLGEALYGGYDGSAYQYTAEILGAVTGAVSSGVVPTALVFSTSATNTAGLTERMRVDSSGNVGIGTSSPSYKLDVTSSVRLGDGTGQVIARINGANSGTNNGAAVYFQNAGTTNFAVGNYSAVVGGAYSTDAVYYLSNANSHIWFISGSEKMRIDSSGYVGIGTTSPSTFGFLAVENTSNFRAGWFYVNAASSLSTPAASFVKKDNNTTTSQVLVNFYTNGSATTQGQINANGANAAAFGSFSDSRLKENIVDLPSQLANIMALRPVEFDYIESEGGGHQIGFVAQEVQEIYPDLVGEREDGMFTLSDLNKNDARLIKAIQEMKAIIDTQANTITALTARIEALETK